MAPHDLHNKFRLQPYRFVGRFLVESKAAFTLVELLMVVAIITVMVSMSSLAFNSLAQSRHADYASIQIAGLIEQAQTYATANQQTVWIGFTNAESGVVVTAYAEAESPTGDLQFTILAASKLLTRVSLARPPVTEQNTTNILDVSENFGNTLAATPVARVDSTNYSLDHVFRIGSGGDIQIAPNTMPRHLEIALIRKDSRPGSKEMRSIVIDGLVGSIKWIDHHDSAGL